MPSSNGNCCFVTPRYDGYKHSPMCMFIFSNCILISQLAQSTNVLSNMHCFTPCPICRHQVRPHTITSVIKLTVRFGSEGIRKVACGKLMVQEGSGVLCTEFICFCHPSWWVGTNRTCIFEADGLKRCISLLNCVNCLIHCLH